MASRGPNRKGGATSKGQVRIIGGERRGHRLQFVDQGGDLRPSSDRMRETLFNWLQFELPGLRVLDLFAGSGVLGAEALSRGAQRAVLVEKKRERAADLKRQLMNEPAIGSALAGDANATVHLIKSADGSFQANLSNGKTVTFSPGTQAAETAEAVHQLSTFLGVGVSTDQPGAIILTS